MIRSILIAFLLGSTLHAQRPSVPEIQPITERFTAAMQATAASPKREKAKVDYLATLDAVFKQVASTGDLDATIQVKTEKERVQKGEQLSEQAKKAMLPLLRAARDKYDRALEPLELEQQAAANAVRRQYILDLDQLQKQLTQRTELEKALAVKAEKERIADQLTPSPDASKGQGAAIPVAIDPATSFHMRGFFDKLKAATTSPRIPKNTLGKRDRGEPFQDLPKDGALRWDLRSPREIGLAHRYCDLCSRSISLPPEKSVARSMENPAETHSQSKLATATRWAQLRCAMEIFFGRWNLPS